MSDYIQRQTMQSLRIIQTAIETVQFHVEGIKKTLSLK